MTIDTGCIDEFMVFGRALTAEEVGRMAAEGQPAG